jgi:hypothetical protein
MKLKQFSRFYFPILLLFLCVFVYGLLTPFLGFYWDDLPYTWFEVASGVQGTIKSIALDRPVLSVFYALPMTIFGEKPLVWQFFAIFSRWIFTLAIFNFLQSFWPKREKTNQAITLLVMVFPGFTQQSISVIYSHAFLVLSLYFLSLTIFTKNLQMDKPSPLTTIFSILLAFICMAAMEYVIGLEFSRLVIIYLINKRKYKKISLIDLAKYSFRTWLPSLVGLFLFIIYRVFLASSVLYSVQKLGGFLVSPINTIFDITWSQITNIYTSIVPVWEAIFKPFSIIDFSTTYGKIHISFTGFLVAMAAFFILLQRKDIIASQDSSPIGLSWVKEAIPLSVCMLFFSGIPFWAANLIPGVVFPNDRFLLPFMLGSVLIIFVILEFVKRKDWVWSILFSILFALSGAYQLYNTNIYRNEWDQFTHFFQQISWRIPSITENTIFVTDELPFIHYSDNSLSAAMNWLYARDSANQSLPYIINYTGNRLGTSLPTLNAGTTIHQNYRIFSFDGSTNEMIIFYHQPPGCVHIADPSLDHLNPLMPSILRNASRRSNSSRIERHENKNSVFFVEETQTSKSWCYFYQKASLAYQFQDWEEIARLGDNAFEIDDYPNDASERIPFIFGYAYTENLEKAIELSEITHDVSNLYDPMLCETWRLIREKIPSTLENQAFFTILENQLDCQFREQ